MSDELKMSKEFSLPLYSAGGGVIKDSTMRNISLKLATFQDYKSANAACCAINSYDKLVEQNNNLRSEIDTLKIKLHNVADALDKLDVAIEEERGYAEWVDVTRVQRILHKIELSCRVGGL